MGSLDSVNSPSMTIQREFCNHLIFSFCSGNYKQAQKGIMCSYPVYWSSIGELFKFLIFTDVSNQAMLLIFSSLEV